MQKDKKNKKENVSNQNNSKTTKNTSKVDGKSKNEKQVSKKKESKTKNTTFKKVLKKILIILVCLFVLAELIYGAFMIYENYTPKFKDLEIEIGSVTSLSVADFVKKDKYLEGAVSITSLDDIDYTSVGTYNVTLSYDGREEEVTLSLVDTTAPLVTFRDVEAYIDYELNIEDFIVSIEDMQKVSSSFISVTEIDGYGEYEFMISVKDESNNETVHTSRLLITWIKEEYEMEIGDTLTKEDLLYNYKEDSALIDDGILKEINSADIGKYELVTTKDGIEFVTTINIVEDLTPPEVELKSVSVYDDEVDSITADTFVKSAADNSGSVTSTITSEIDYTYIGEQEVEITVSDMYGNSTKGTTTLTIKKDTTGPVFSGLSDLSVAKGTEINYNTGVSATDAKDGSCSFTVDSSGVDTTTAGTYYATYTSYDLSGNKTTKKRKVEVLPSNEDTEALVQEVVSSLSDDIATITKYVRNSISYSHKRGEDSVWYGLTYHTGDCYVHAKVLQAILEAKGYETLLIWTTDETHYWNLVYIEGTGWRHVDSTPFNATIQAKITDYMTDAVRLKSLSGRTWDTSLWPEAI